MSDQQKLLSSALSRVAQAHKDDYFVLCVECVYAERFAARDDSCLEFC